MTTALVAVPNIENPFTTTPIPAQGWLGGILRRPDHAAVARELENLLASRFPEIPWPAEIETAVRKHRLTRANASHELHALWRKALTTFVSDRKIDDREDAYLAQLRHAFDLGEDAIAEDFAAVVHPIYQQCIEEVLATGTVTSETKKLLGTYAEHLRT